MLFKKHGKVIMIGDSISDCGRARPLGEGREDSYGKGYIALVNALIKANYPELCLRIINMGVSGDTTRSLLARWQTDVLDQNPDYVTVLIGINDVWRHFDLPQIDYKHVPLNEYKNNLRKLAELTKTKTGHIIFLSPYFMEPNPQDPMRVMMEAYAKAAREVAEENRLICVDLQKAFDAYFEHCHPMSVAWDRVHPDLTGHMVIAKAFLKEIGFEWR